MKFLINSFILLVLGIGLITASEKFWKMEFLSFLGLFSIVGGLAYFFLFIHLAFGTF